MFLTLILVCICAYLWVDNRRLLESRISEAIQSSLEKEKELTFKDVRILALTGEVEDLRAQLAVLTRATEDVGRRASTAEDELRKTILELQDMRESKEGMEVLHSRVIARREAEYVVLQARMEGEIRKLVQSNVELTVRGEKLEFKNIELRDRVSEFNHRLNNGRPTEDVPNHSPPDYQYDYPIRGHKRSPAVAGLQDDLDRAAVPVRNWAFTVPNGMVL